MRKRQAKKLLPKKEPKSELAIGIKSYKEYLVKNKKKNSPITALRYLDWVNKEKSLQLIIAEIFSSYYASFEMLGHAILEVATHKKRS